MRQHAKGESLRLRMSRWPGLVFLPGLTACGAFEDTMIGDNAPVWLFVSLIATALGGGGGMFLAFLRRFRRHDLGSGGAPPSAFALPGILLCVVVGVATLWFAFSNLFSDVIPPGQKWSNIFAWLVGAVAGGVGAYLGGRELAHRQHHAMSVTDAAKSRAIGSTDTEDG